MVTPARWRTAECPRSERSERALWMAWSLCGMPEVSQRTVFEESERRSGG